MSVHYQISRSFDVTQPLLKADGLQKSYRQRLVVNNVSLSVSEKEIVGLLGPNGAGKSTTFGMIAGLTSPDKGSVQLCSTTVTGHPLDERARLGLGYLAQESTIFQGLSVEDNLRVPLEASKVAPSSANERIEVILERFELAHLRSSLGRMLSGGERRRVEMARALLLEPKVMLLDEPFAGVDPIATEGIRGFVSNLKRQGLGVLITDHNVRETLSICDRAYIIAEGKILVSGTPKEIIENPIARREYLGETFTL